MARPSVAQERRAQIIEATLRTIAAHGISSTTLDRIADEAGMSRGHVRHFVGNRDRLLADTARYFYADEDTGNPVILPASAASVSEALEHLFGDQFQESSDDNAIVLGFVDLARTSEPIAAILTEAYGSALDDLIRFIAVEYPNAPEASRTVVAQGILTAALGSVFIGDFDPTTQRTVRSRAAAEALLTTL